MKKFMKSSIWSDLLKVGSFPQRDLIDKHFQVFSLMNQIISNYQRKRDRSGGLSQSGLKVILLRLGNFHTDVRRKDVMSSLFLFILFSKNWMYFPGKKTLSSKYFDLDCVFSVKYKRRPLAGYSTTSFSSRELPATASTLFSD